VLSPLRKQGKTNDEIRTDTKMEPIGVMVRGARLAWLEQILMMGEERLPRRTLCGYLAGESSRPRKRPDLRWSDVIVRDLRCTSLGVGDVVRAIEEATGEWGEAMAAREQEEKQDKQYRYLCSLCGQKVQSKEGLTNHTRAKHGREPVVEGEERQRKVVRCGGGCDFVAKSEWGLTKHREGSKCRRQGQVELQAEEVVVKEGKDGKKGLTCGEGCVFVAKSKAGLAVHRAGNKCRRRRSFGVEGSVTATLLKRSPSKIVAKGNRPRREIYQAGKYERLANGDRDWEVE
jgi:hypothetical protein